MKHRPPQKSSMKQKLAAALSIVNALNVCAPMALPYVNVTRNYSATGGQAAPSGGEADPVDALIFAVQKAMQPSIAYAEDNPTTVTSDTPGNPVSVPGYQSANVTLVNGGIMSVKNGGTATSTTISKGGTQIVNAGGKATSTTIYGGGTLDVSGGITSNTTQNGGTMTVTGVTGTGGTAVSTTVNAGTITVKDGGTADNVTLVGGACELKNGASASGTLQGHGTATHENGTLHVGSAGNFGSLIVSGGTLKTPNAVEIQGGASSNGAITVNGGGTFQAGGNVTISSSGSLTVSSGGLLSAASLDAKNNTTFSLSGGTLAAKGNISLQPLTAAAGTVSAGGTLSLIGATKSGGAALHLAAGNSIETTGLIEATTVSAVEDISANGQQINATHISAGGAITASAISAAGNISARDVSADSVTVGGNMTASGTVNVTELTGSMTMNGGTANLTSAIGTVTLNGGTENLLAGGTATRTIINDGGVQNIANGATATSTTIQGGTQNVENGGVASGGTLKSGAQNIASGGKTTGTQIYGGTQRIASGGQATSTTVAQRGTQLISAGGTATSTHVLSGGTQNVKRGGVVLGGMVEKGAALAFEDPDDVKGISGGGGRIITKDGSVDGGTLIGGEHAVVSGVTVSSMTLQGGAQTIASGGTAVATTISAGAAQTLNAGGTATFTTISAGGVQTLQKGTPNAPGGVSEHISLEGGTLVVNDYARAQLDESNGGVLRLLDLGLAEAQFGALDVPSSVTNYNLTTLYAQGDNVRLGLGDESNHSVANKTLRIENMDGYANFIVNTDLANNRSDRIVIGTATNATQANTVQINHDPTLAKGEEVTSANATVATVGSGNATFAGVKSTINSIDYFPEIETTDGGRTWVIRRVLKSAGNNTHSTVMGMTAGMATLAAGSDFIGAAVDGLSLPSNAGKDGVAAFAKLGGGTMRQDTGSHVNVNTWNAILALGHKNRKEKSAFEYGAFFEYGSGNYTTHNDGLRGDGSAKYTGGGVLAKWTAAHGLYVEGSLRAGTVHDDASSVLRDAAGNAYGYETDAGYFGAHIGVGKEIPLANGDAVDVYGKFFFNRRNGVSFTANSRDFDLDAVKSEILRVGARYTMKREKWNFYGDVAYEYEFGGEATGTVDGLAIRSADIKGGSARLELGATMKPDKNSPWSLDLNVAGFAGKKQGVTGGVSVSFTF